MPKILFVGGGSIGHIAPSVAVWQVLQEDGWEGQFVCTDRTDDKLFLEANKIPYFALHAPRLSFSFLWQFPKAVRQAKEVLKKEQPSVVFSKGGYGSLPICFAAKKLKIPVVLHESDAVSGRSNRIVARWASFVCYGFPQRKKKLNRKYTGNPVRKGITEGNRDVGLRLSGFSGSKPILLVIGGSQGSLAINEVIRYRLPDLHKYVDIIHITGHGKQITDEPIPGYWARPFVTQELPDLYAAADIALSRAGAGGISELAANGIPSLLVPLRGVGHDHQMDNALAVEQAKACILIEERELAGRILTVLHELTRNADQLAALGEAIYKLHQPMAAHTIAAIIHDVVAKGIKQT